MMLTLNDKIELLERLGQYMLSEDNAWLEAKQQAMRANPWFIPGHIDIAVENIAQAYLQKEKVQRWMDNYSLPLTVKKVGVVAAGNIPLVGFHDFLCVFLSGHRLFLKLSSKDTVLMSHLLQQLTEWDSRVGALVQVAAMLKDCDAYIATGSNNTARYFEQYFGKYPHIIRRNRTSVAILDGTETKEELERLADDVFCYFGLGCRNVTQLCLPPGYDFQPLFQSFSRYEHYSNLHKYRNNYDYHLALYLLNRVPYLSNDSVLLVENELPFSAVAVLHYRYYTNKAALEESLSKSGDIQCIAGHGFIPFGDTQKPGLNDYADGIDTMKFLCSLG